MKDLQVTNYNGIEVVDSREVAEMVEKQHSHLCRDIAGYIDILSKNPNLDSSDFFIPSTYKQEGNGKEVRCYLLTKKGCDMVANKMTGEKGVLFTAAYVTAFEKLRQAVKQPQFSTLSPQLQALINIEMRQQEHEKRMALMEEKQQHFDDAFKSAMETMAAPTVNRDAWRDEINHSVRQMCAENGLNYQKTISDMYAELEEKAGVSLSRRQTNLRERMRIGGAKYAQREAITKLHVIAEDKKLREIYAGIVRQRSARLIAARPQLRH